MFQSAAEILYLLLPAIAANMAPVFATHYDWLPGLNHPLDGGLSLNNHRLLGDNKTIRGLAVGLIAGSLLGFIQYLLSEQSWSKSLSLIDYSSAPTAIIVAGTISFAALLGDVIKSFIKRRLGKSSGVSWIPYDQIDFAIGALIIAALFTTLTITHFIVAVTFIGLGSYLVSRIGVTLKIKKTI